MRIAIFQPPYPTPGTRASAEECLTWMRTRIDGLTPGGQDLVLLPEYANTPGLNDRELLRDFASAQGAEFVQAVAAAAARLGCLMAMACAVRSGSRWFNRTLVFDETGELASTYDKIHLTDVEKDALGLTPGSVHSAFQHQENSFGFATCFDISFPEHFVTLAAQDVDLVLCPSYQRSEPADRLRAVAQVRAIDTGAYLIRSSYAMEDPEVGGRSLVAAPDGILLADAGSEAGVTSVDIEPARKLVKPASHGQPDVEHRALLEAHRRPAAYRSRVHWARQIAAAPFPHLCAHRGLSTACPENTIPAFAAAIAVGAHEIELDLFSSRDGVLVVCHDEAVDRTTDGTGKVNDLEWEEIRSLEAGVLFGEAWRGVRMPRFEEVLELVDGRAGLNVHLHLEDEAVRRVCDLLSEYGLTASVYVAAHTEAELRAALEYAPEVHRACLVGQNDLNTMIETAERYACQRVQFGRTVTAEHIRRAHELGMTCNLFWSDDPDDARQYANNGIDVILTNCAHILIAEDFNKERV